MNEPNPFSLEPKDLEKEINFSERRVAAASNNLRNASNQVSQDGSYFLQEDLFRREQHLAACYQARAQNAAKAMPAATGGSGGSAKPAVSARPVAPVRPVATIRQNVVQSQPVVNAAAMKAPALFATDQGGFFDDNDNRPPIIIMDKGVPRAWRYDDKIHGKR